MRERLVSQHERELDEREDGTGGWAEPGLSELEQRLRKLENSSPASRHSGSPGPPEAAQHGTRPATRELTRRNGSTLTGSGR